MKILYLYAELMGYQIPVLEELVKTYDAEVHVIHFDYKNNTPYLPPLIKGVTYYKRSEFDLNRMMDLSKEINPDLVFVSGWMDKDYLKVCREMKNKGSIVVAGIDAQWTGGTKQFIRTLVSPFTFNKCVSKIWVSGTYQYEYARKLGFKKSDIIFNCYTADRKLFSSNYRPTSNSQDYDKNFLFLGRFIEIKGIDNLLTAWNEIEDKKGWTLTFIGNGNLKNKILENKSVILKNFMDPGELSLEIQKYGFLILPSLKEPWALVIHEAMCAGLPVIASDCCGAAPAFIIPGFSGYTFKTDSVLALKNMISQVIDMDSQKLNQMSENAYSRSRIITPAITASSFMSALIN